MSIINVRPSSIDLLISIHFVYETRLQFQLRMKQDKKRGKKNMSKQLSKRCSNENFNIFERWNEFNP